MESNTCGFRNCVPILKGVAIVSGSMFAGIALYIQKVEHPARSTLPTEFAVSEWRESYNRAAPLQASLAAISGLASLFTFGSIVNSCCKTIGNGSVKAIVKSAEGTVRHCGGAGNHCGLGWLIGGGLMAAIIPYTLLVVAPINKKLFAKDIDTFSDDTRQLLAKWGELHSVRTGLAFAALGVFFFKVFKHSHSVLLVKS